MTGILERRELVAINGHVLVVDRDGARWERNGNRVTAQVATRGAKRWGRLEQRPCCPLHGPAEQLDAKYCLVCGGRLYPSLDPLGRAAPP